ncbi:hypothetical protein EVAR_46158_1 [Eumeta japonica]|uniref:Uncharacterized protein n=1 Tax=Eumeta variegata TaxID=151549 RepID=A0A4C2AET2_EUMVA|nr:hypothetical protein EVAR_46158_1 [Eumeta japonica]
MIVLRSKVILLYEQFVSPDMRERVMAYTLQVCPFCGAVETTPQVVSLPLVYLSKRQTAPLSPLHSAVPAFGKVLVNRYPFLWVHFTVIE